MSSSPPAIVRFGKYELLATLGQGGMAQVFLARHRGPMGFEKLCVIKKIHPHLATEQQFIDMFLDEARLAARINNPRVVQIYELGQVGNMYFMAMEYLVGESLSAIIKQGLRLHAPLDPGVAARVVAEAAAGLHAAHELKSLAGEALEVVHRDMTPSNILVLNDGGVKVVDFGVAKAKNRVAKTVEGEVKGKFAYMSPEQLTNQTVDRRSDIFSLGVVLWEALSLRRLFRAESHGATVMMIVQGDVKPPSHFRPEVHPQLDAIALKALAKNPSERFQTAEAFREALEDFLHGSERRIGLKEVRGTMMMLFAERMRARERVLERVAALGEASVELAAPSLASELEDSGSSSLALPWSIEELAGEQDVTLLRSQNDDDGMGATEVTPASAPGVNPMEVTVPDPADRSPDTTVPEVPADLARRMLAEQRDRKATLVEEGLPASLLHDRGPAGSWEAAPSMPGSFPRVKRRSPWLIPLVLSSAVLLLGGALALVLTDTIPLGIGTEDGDEEVAEGRPRDSDDPDESADEGDDDERVDEEAPAGGPELDEIEHPDRHDGDATKSKKGKKGKKGSDGEKAAAKGPATALVLPPLPATARAPGTKPIKKRPVRKPGKGTKPDKAVSSAAPGTLFLATEPKAVIFLGKRNLGESPLKGVSLPAGTHKLTAVDEGTTMRRTFTIIIEAGKETRMLKKL